MEKLSAIAECVTTCVEKLSVIASCVLTCLERLSAAAEYCFQDIKKLQLCKIAFDKIVLTINN